MSARETGDSSAIPAGTSADPVPNLPARPSWETADPAPRPAAPLRPASVAAVRPAPVTAPRPYYAAPASAAAPPPAAPPLAQEETVKYDLAGNPIASSPPPPTPYAPPAPFGYSAGTAAVWPPPINGVAPGGFRNNSGEQDQVPTEIERLRWHWGAFFFPILWTKKHGLTTIAAALAGGLFVLRMLRVVFQFVSPVAFLAICGVYAVTYFAVQIYFGINGHRIGWRNRHFPGGLEEYFKVQNAWMWWGLGINVTLGVVLPILALMGLFSLGVSSSRANPYGSRYGTGSGSGYHRPVSAWPSGGNAAPGDSSSAAPAQGSN